tara:strand:- start:63 stop:518 length:456 start_codon:yes stop_codon:yes gene_type:complete
MNTKSKVAPVIASKEPVVDNHGYIIVDERQSKPYLIDLIFKKEQETLDLNGQVKDLKREVDMVTRDRVRAKLKAGRLASENKKLNRRIEGYEQDIKGASEEMKDLREQLIQAKEVILSLQIEKLGLLDRACEADEMQTRLDKIQLLITEQL